MSPFRFCLLALLLVSTALPAQAKATDPQRPLGTFGNWHTFAFAEHDQQVCYMALVKTPPVNKKFKRSVIRLMITHRPAEGSKDVISYSPGYMFKPESTVTVRAGGKTFDLFTTKDTAWARDAMTDHAIAMAIHGGKGMTLAGAPLQKGIPTVTDTLDLKGAPEAYRAIGKACGLEVEAEKPAKTTKKPAKPTTKSNLKTKGKL
jgi:Invasion associated locus B (IalB) protein